MKTNNIEMIFEYLLQYDSKIRKKVESQESKREKYIFLGMIISYGIALFCAIFFHYISQIYWLKIVSLFLLTLSLILVTFYNIIIIYKGFKVFKSGTIKFFLESRTQFSSEGYIFSNSLTQFDNEELLYVREYLFLEIDQMKKRISLLIGLIDKIGIIPASVSLFFAIYKNIENYQHLYDKFDWLAYGIIGIFIVGIIALSSIPKIERYILLLDTAINLKEKN